MLFFSRVYANQDINSEGDRNMPPPSVPLRQDYSELRAPEKRPTQGELSALPFFLSKNAGHKFLFVKVT